MVYIFSLCVGTGLLSPIYTGICFLNAFVLDKVHSHCRHLIILLLLLVSYSLFIKDCKKRRKMNEKMKRFKDWLQVSKVYQELFYLLKHGANEQEKYDWASIFLLQPIWIRTINLNKWEIKCISIHVLILKDSYIAPSQLEYLVLKQRDQCQ